MKILALDLSFTNTGWALGAPGQTPINDSLHFAKRGSRNADHFAGFHHWLTLHLAEHDPDIVAIEGPLAPSFMRGHTTTDTARALMGLIAVAELATHEFGDVREHAVSTIRQFFLGTSKIKSRDAKQMTFDRCVQLGWKPKDKDAADALALWAYQVSLISPAEGIKLLPLFWRASA